jgi:hypothetical protein
MRWATRAWREYVRWIDAGKEDVMVWKRLVALGMTVFTVAFVVGFPLSAWASHRWGCWKYANYSIYWYNGASGDYYYIYNEEARTDSNAWSPYTDVYLAPVSARGSTDHINAYSGYYGATGWLGLAQIVRYSGCTIYEGRAYLNRSYLDSGSYSRTNKKHVACQEIAHLFGLGHNRSQTNTCMNDTILYAPYPNTHDRDLVNALY